MFGLVVAGAAISYLLQLNRTYRSESDEGPEAKVSSSTAGEIPASAATSFPSSAEDFEREARAKPNDVSAWLRAGHAWYDQAKAMAYGETCYRKR
jgi:hypothetical protein